MIGGPMPVSLPLIRQNGSAVIRVYDEAGNIIEAHEQGRDCRD
jgi:hypothetical protein